MRDTWPLLETIPFPAIRRGRLDTLQVNVGYRCNQSCVHCHVNAGPNRTEEMAGEVADMVLAFLERRRIPTLDITGGAPELNPHFRRLVTARARHGRARDGPLQPHDPGSGRARRTSPNSSPASRSRSSRRCRAIWRTMSTASAARACSTARSAGCSGSTRSATGATDGLVLNLVYNPQGPSLPPAQDQLEADYKRVLGETTASCSIGCSRSPTCRSSASARC